MGLEVSAIATEIAKGVAWGISVAGFFKLVGDALHEKTSQTISLWLKNRSVSAMILADKATSWPGTFSQVFDGLFGASRFSWRGFFRSATATTFIYFAVVLSSSQYAFGQQFVFSQWKVPAILWAGAVVVDYLSLIETRTVLRLMTATANGVSLSAWLLVDAVLTLGFAAFLLLIWNCLPAAMLEMTRTGLASNSISFWEALPWYYLDRIDGVTSEWISNLTPSILVPSHISTKVLPGESGPFLSPTVPTYATAFFTSIWLWLYTASGLLLRAAQRFDLGLYWFNGFFDTDRKPLQSIGIVAGLLMSLIYWSGALLLALIHPN